MCLYAKALNASTTKRHDYITTYVNDLASVIDFDVLKGTTLKLAVDPLGGAGVFYWPRIAEKYNLPFEVLNKSGRLNFPLHDSRLGQPHPHGLLQPLRHGVDDRKQRQVRCRVGVRHGP